jgi:hypothetical protein
MYVIVLTIGHPAPIALRAMRVRGNPRRAHPGYIAEAWMQAAARPSSMVTIVPVSHHDHADWTTPGNDADRRRRPEGRR